MKAAISRYLDSFSRCLGCWIMRSMIQTSDNVIKQIVFSKKLPLVFFCSLVFLVPGIRLHTQDLSWENPQILIERNVRFPRVTQGGGKIALVYEEIIPGPVQGGEIWLHLWTTTDMKTWVKKPRFAGPFRYVDKETEIYSLQMDSKGDIYLAVTAAEKKIRIYYSDNGGTTFTHTDINSVETTVSPKLFMRNDGTFYLFVTYQTANSLSIYYLLLTDDIFDKNQVDLAFAPLVTESGFGFNFLPYYCLHGNKDYVVFQSRTAGETTGYQLYVKTSGDRGKTWSQAEIITSIRETIRGITSEPGEFSNQRPYIASIGGNLYVTWERQLEGSYPQIYLSTLDDNGNMKSYERVTDNSFSCFFPILIYQNSILYVLWFDNQRGDDHIKIAKKAGNEYVEQDLSISVPGSSQFALQAKIGNALYLFWENKLGSVSRLVTLEPDQSVDPPAIFTRNFVSARPQKGSVAIIEWNVPADSSGISGFRYFWYKEGSRSLDTSATVFKDIRRGEFRATSDGRWIFELQAEDYAGNWSRTSSVVFVRDNSPPGKVSFVPPPTDRNGFLSSNSFTVSWNPPPDADVAGYAYSFNLVTPDTRIAIDSVKTDRLTAPGTVIQLFEKSKSYTNVDNGIWAFSVRAIDYVGNYGETTSLLLRLDKYVAVTYVSYINPETDVFGVTKLGIVGRGFATNGTITRIVLDRDGKEPYDYSFSGTAAQYRVANDARIENFTVRDLEEGSYKVGLFHEKRGMYFSSITVSIEPMRTVKVSEGGFPPGYIPQWAVTERPLLSVHVNDVIIVLLLLFLALALIVSARKLASVMREGQFIEAEVLAIMTGVDTGTKMEKQVKRLKTKGLSLRIKFAALSTVQVILIILMLSITLSYYMIQTQGGILADGLLQRVKVLLSSISSGAEKALPLELTTDLGILLDQKSAMEEAESITITAISKLGAGQAPSDKEYVWASNDPEINKKIDTGQYVTGVSILDDKGVSALVPGLAKRINATATEQVSALAEELKTLINESQSLISRTDEKSRQRYAELTSAVEVKGRTLSEKLAAISSVVESYPSFDIDSLKPVYTFFKPIVYRLAGDDLYFRGVVRLTVSTDKIVETIARSQNELIVRIAIISLVAIAVGILGAILLASITIRPIKKLALGVAKIRDTEDKAMLKDHVIDIKQKDEIRQLADTINQMTQGLVKASLASKDITIGKEVQKMFIPLEKGADGKKGTTARDSNDFVEIFGYYEGAKGVSGDYFDFVKLDAEHYAFIKCDVSGKGVPAALIMVEVATIFIDYFHNWTLKNPGIKNNLLVEKINDLVEGRGFKGRFAALILGILNVKNGTIYFCNAGDNIVHVYVEQKKKMVEKQLPNSPAAGVFHSSLIQMQGGFKQVTEVLAKSDTLFLMSDGFDESKRIFRDSRGTPFKCDEPSLKEGEDHDKNHKKGEDGEVLGIERIDNLINAIRHKDKLFSLIKAHQNESAGEITFDFSTSDSSVQDTVMGLVSVEKMFRIYRKENTTGDDKVIIDKKIDEYLSKHLVQYRQYFTHRVELAEDPQYVMFTHLNEDEQYDDLTLLAIRMK